jgi:hypothetical protein
LVPLHSVGKRLHIFGEARAAKAQSCLQEGVPDALVVAHRFGDLYHICARAFAQIGNRVDIGDF